jgi:hypothetical protein
MLKAWCKFGLVWEVGEHVGLVPRKAAILASQALHRVDSKSLGELLVERGLVTRARCDEALEYGRTHGLRLGEALMALGYANNEMISCGLGQQFGLTPTRGTH